MLKYCLIAISLIAFSTVARAADVPKVDFSALIPDLDGKPMKASAPSATDPNCDKCVALTLGKVAQVALCNAYQDDKRSADEKFKDCAFALTLSPSARAKRAESPVLRSHDRPT